MPRRPHQTRCTRLAAQQMQDTPQTIKGKEGHGHRQKDGTQPSIDRERTMDPTMPTPASQDQATRPKDEAHQGRSGPRSSTTRPQVQEGPRSPRKEGHQTPGPAPQCQPRPSIHLSETPYWHGPRTLDEQGVSHPNPSHEQGTDARLTTQRQGRAPSPGVTSGLQREKRVKHIRKAWAATITAGSTSTFNPCPAR